MITIGIIGNGFVGNATLLFGNSGKSLNIETLVYDRDENKCVPKGTVLKDLLKTNLIFICVPTPMSETGECYLHIAESVVQKLKDLNYKGFIILRSTVPVGTSERLDCYFSPEFLTEKNYKQDFIHNKDWIFGIPEGKCDKEAETFKLLIQSLLTTSKEEGNIEYDSCYFVTTKEAEMIKLMKNCFLATKVGFCNEMFEFCEKWEINYENVRHLVVKDERIGSSHTQVPGHDGRKGFGGTCFPKDMNNLNFEMNKIGMKSFIIKNAIERNEKVDRNEQDWKSDEGRAFVKKK